MSRTWERLVTDLFALVELTHSQTISGKTETRGYDVYQGEWIKASVPTTGEDVWFTLEDWERRDKTDCRILGMAMFLVLDAEGGYIGHWYTFDDFIDWTRQYLRASSHLIVFVDPPLVGAAV